jgi:hypothetical protein
MGMPINAREFAALCFLVDTSPWGDLKVSKIFDRVPLLDLGFGAFKELKEERKNAVVQYLEEKGIEKPACVEDHIIIYRQ